MADDKDVKNPRVSKQIVKLESLIDLMEQKLIDKPDLTDEQIAGVEQAIDEFTAKLNAVVPDDGTPEPTAA